MRGREGKKREAVQDDGAADEDGHRVPLGPAHQAQVPQSLREGGREGRGGGELLLPEKTRSGNVRRSIYGGRGRVLRAGVCVEVVADGVREMACWWWSFHLLVVWPVLEFVEQQGLERPPGEQQQRQPPPA